MLYRLDLCLFNALLDLIFPSTRSSVRVLLRAQLAKSKGFLQSAHRDLGAGHDISLEKNSENVVSFLKQKENLFFFFLSFSLGLQFFGHV